MKSIYLTRRIVAVSLTAAMTMAAPAHAHDVYADDHAPIGIMADHAHKMGEVMFSARYMHMAMRGNQIGADNATPEEIVTTVPNRFFGTPMQPPTLRIVPTEMRTDMVMLGAMYAPSDAVTLMVMGSYSEKEMDPVTFQGGMGTNRLGEFTTNPKGLGDIKVAALFPLLGHPDAKSDARDELTLKVGISAPTGSTTKRAQILAPMGGTPTVRTPYMMQIGSGSWDFEPALTYKMRHGKLGLGMQGSAKISLERNDQDYRLGNVYEATAWTSYRPAQWVSLSARAKFRAMGRIGGIDPAIMGPVQTANPDFQGGERIDLIAGANFVATHGALAGHRLGLEIGKPVYQDLNGPQMKGDWVLTLGWQKAL
ncbi:transporter [Sphingorhabdus sp. Alg239-R122]|uniref:transporter n=1 Tax=Sphingorhabdus sp. Alg239-R122 TaxID=2305989 RepID=UPI0013DB220E|nr:transporter [Sphingorhabdus sp. Alg239-R122]